MTPLPSRSVEAPAWGPAGTKKTHRGRRRAPTFSGGVMVSDFRSIQNLGLVSYTSQLRRIINPDSLIRHVFPEVKVFLYRASQCGWLRSSVSRRRSSARPFEGHLASPHHANCISLDSPSWSVVCRTYNEAQVLSVVWGASCGCLRHSRRDQDNSIYPRQGVLRVPGWAKLPPISQRRVQNVSIYLRPTIAHPHPFRSQIGNYKSHRVLHPAVSTRDR